MVSTVRPKASETPKRPMPTWGKAAAMTALPQPPKVSQNVPIASATYFFVSILFPPAHPGKISSLPVPSQSPVLGLTSLQVLGQVFVHLEHGHLLLAEHRLQLGVRQD